MNYRDIINYFENLATSHKEIKQSYHGDYRQILEAELSKIIYPALWIESPEARLIGDINSKEMVWDCVLVVLISDNARNFQAANVNIDKSLGIAMDLLSRLMKDYDEDVLIGFNVDSVTLDLVWSENPDNNQGWRISFTINTKEPRLCYDESKWD